MMMRGTSGGRRIDPPGSGSNSACFFGMAKRRGGAYGCDNDQYEHQPTFCEADTLKEVLWHGATSFPHRRNSRKKQKALCLQKEHDFVFL